MCEKKKQWKQNWERWKCSCVCESKRESVQGLDWVHLFPLYVFISHFYSFVLQSFCFYFFHPRFNSIAFSLSHVFSCSIVLSFTQSPAFTSISLYSVTHTPPSTHTHIREISKRIRGKKLNSPNKWYNIIKKDRLPNVYLKATFGCLSVCVC